MFAFAATKYAPILVACAQLERFEMTRRDLFMPSLQKRLSAKSAQGGVATLLVVMVLLFVVSMVAAYTGRNILFEQRISTNLFQATVSSEAAEAGMDWALGLLNGSLIDDNCQPIEDLSAITPISSRSFRDRYVSIDSASGAISVPVAVRNGPQWPSCVLYPDGTWRCSCPSAGGPALTAPAGSALAPAFRVRFVQIREPIPLNPGLVRIEVNGCTALDNACLDFKPADPASCRGSVCSTLALTGGLKSLPTAAVTARGTFDLGTSVATIANGGVGSSGLLIVAGGAVNQASLNLQSVPGMPIANAVVSFDSGLSAAAFTGDRMFAALFGIWPNTFADQPSVVRLNCAGGCGAGTVRNALKLNPGRPLLVQGSLALDGGVAIGSSTNPVLIVATGNIGFTAATDVYGLVYSRAASWSTSGNGRIIGAAVGESNIAGTSTFTVAYDARVLDALRWTTGSFVRVPGSWADFQ